MTDFVCSGNQTIAGECRPIALDCAPLPTLRLASVACRRGDRVLFEELDLELAAGQLVWLCGHNGSGKTSLLRLVAGLSKPDAGKLSWGGEPIHLSASYREQLVYLGHANALKDELAVEEALAFVARMHRCDASPQNLLGALERFGLARWRRAPVRTLSQGQRRRVALARLALHRRPALWLLDEPYDALDLQGSERLDALLAEHLSRGGSVLLASHQAPATPALSFRRFRLAEDDFESDSAIEAATE